MARYIDADALIESIKNELWDWDSLDGITSTTVLKQTITDIQNAPTTDVVERKRGKWETEIRTIRGHKIPFPVCSVCGKYAVDEYIYCPNCGAQMKSE